MTDSDVEDKFRELTKHVLDPQQQQNIVSNVWKLESLPNLDELIETLAIK
jgi:2-methylcitrate dehydratase PrpD